MQRPQAEPLGPAEAMRHAAAVPGERRAEAASASPRPAAAMLELTATAGRPALAGSRASAAV
ncbi:hypothetical protein ABIF66_008442 [Bradyrhizobium japonicum]